MLLLPIRPACSTDLAAIGDITRQARAFLKAQGVDQWQGPYPTEADFASDILQGSCFVVPDSANVPSAVFTLAEGAEPAYETLVAGHWLTNPGAAYLTIHRMAAADAARGTRAAELLLCFAKQQAQARSLSLRTDTHAENLPMRRLLARCGFCYCGVVVYGPDVEGGCVRVGYEYPF